MGQHCSSADSAEEGAPPSRRQSSKYRSQLNNSSSSPRKKVTATRTFGEEDSPKRDEPRCDSQESEWVAGTSSTSEIIGLAHRSVPRPLLVPREALSKDFREYSSTKFGGQDNAFLGVASAHALPNGKGRNGVLCVGEGCDITLLNFDTGHILHRWLRAHSRDINRVTRPSPKDDDMFFTASRDTTVKGWRVGEASHSVAFEGHTLNVTAMDFHPEGGRLVTGSRDNTVRLWDTLSNGQCIASQDVKLNIVHFVKWIPTMNLVAQGGEDLTVRLWDTRSERDTLELQHTLANFDYHPICADLVTEAEGGSEHVLYTGHNGFNGSGAMITEWDLRNGGAQVRSYRGHNLTVRAIRKLRAGPNAGCLASVGDDDTLRLWRSGPLHDNTLEPVEKPLATVALPEGRPTSIDETPEGKLLIGLRSGSVLVLNPLDLRNFGERYRYLGSPFLE